MRNAAKRLAASIEGLAPERIALILALGFVLGTFPLVGCPTALCALAAFALRLNFPTLQLVNHLSSPLQIALLIPFTRLGSRIMGSSAVFADTFALGLGEAVVHSIAGWLCVSAPLGVFLYISTVCILRKRPRVCIKEAEYPA